jgi:hypothetical protein
MRPRLPDARFVSRWRMTLTFDPASAERALQLKPYIFFDMAINMPCGPAAQTVPSRITFAKMAGLPPNLRFSAR